MSELVWSLNGKYLKDFGIYISSSDGLFDELKPKKQNSVEWPEYNGLALDLTAKNKYESREIELSGWVEGEDWQQMRHNFISVFGEFRKSGKQRLSLDVFGEKTLIYDVRCEDKIELNKKFRKGKMIGFFKVKLTEHNPIKRIFYTNKADLQLSFSSPSWVEINIDGVIETKKGNISINRTLASRNLTRYNFPGRNLATNSEQFIDSNNSWVRDFILSETLLSGAEYTIKVWTKVPNNNPNSYFTIGDQTGWLVNLSKITPTEFVGKIKMPRNSSGQLVLQRTPDDSSWYQFQKLKIEKGNKATDWTPAPEDQHYISIAGNIDEISNLTTNAEVLWERL